MTAKYDRAFNGIQDRETLRKIFAAIGASLERDSENVSQVVPVSFFSSEQVGINPKTQEEVTP